MELLDCGHVELAGGGCATIGCRNEQKASDECGKPFPWNPQEAWEPTTCAQPYGHDGPHVSKIEWTSPDWGWASIPAIDESGHEQR